MTTSWQGMSILVVEDDETMRELFIDCLEELRTTIFKAANGIEALAILEANAIDVVVSDIQMPRMDGLELLKQIRAKKTALPIVLLVTGQSQLNEKGAKDAGAFGLVYKPFRMSEFTKIVESTLTLAKANKKAS